MVGFDLDHDYFLEIVQNLPEDVAVVLRLHGNGGGEWTFRLLDGEVEVLEGDIEPNDCRVECSVGDFSALIRGEMDGRHGFFEGKLKVSGDVGLAIHLEKAVRHTLLPLAFRIVGP